MEVEKKKSNVADKIVSDPNAVQEDSSDECKQTLRQEVLRLEQTVQETELKCQKYLEDKKKLKSNVNHLKKQLVDVKTKLSLANLKCEESVKKLTEATAEWKAFQQDLLTTVKVANDLKIEAQESVERLTVKNKKLNERIPILEAEINRLQEQLLNGPASDRVLSGKTSSECQNAQENVVNDNARLEEEKIPDASNSAVKPMSEIDDPSGKSTDVIDGSVEKSPEKAEDVSDAKSMFPPKVVPRRSVSVQPFCVTVAPRSPLRSISIDPVPSNTNNTSNNQLIQGPKSRDPLSYPSSRKSIAKYVDFRTASQMSVKNLIMSLEKASKTPSAPSPIVTSPVSSPTVVVLRQQSLNAVAEPLHPVVTSRFSNPEPRASKSNDSTINSLQPSSVPSRTDQITTISIREPQHSQKVPSVDRELENKSNTPIKRPCTITSSLEIIPTHEEYTQTQNKNNEENSRQQVQMKSPTSSPKKSSMSSPSSPLNKPLVLFKMENLRSNFRYLSKDYSD